MIRLLCCVSPFVVRDSSAVRTEKEEVCGRFKNNSKKKKTKTKKNFFVLCVEEEGEEGSRTKKKTQTHKG